MKERDPLSDLLSQMGDIVHLARDKAKEPFADDVPSGIQERLNHVELMVHALRQVANEEVRLKGLSDQEIATRLFRQKEILPKKEQRIIEHTLSLTRDTLGMKYALMAAEKKALAPVEAKPFGTQKSTAPQINKRKAQFKKLRGDEKWKKL